MDEEKENNVCRYFGDQGYFEVVKLEQLLVQES